jgi:uncharacterized protein (DUF1501 family)
MHHHLSRRAFLQLAGGALGSALLSPLLEPSLLLAQSPGKGAGKNLIFVNLLGGLDGLSAFPYYDGGAASLIREKLRPSLAIPTELVIPVPGQNGIPDKIGLHPSFAKLAQHAGSHLKIIKGYGIPGELERSHDTCQILMSLGASKLSSGDMTGFMARLMDRHDWESYQFWALSSTNPSDTNTRKKPPIVVSDLSNLEVRSIAWESESDLQQALDVSRQLIEIRTPKSALEARYRSVQQSTDLVLSRVRRDIIKQVVGNNLAGDYSDSGIGHNLRDAAKILRAKKLAPDSGMSGRDTLILCAQGGYDTHSDQLTTDLTVGGLPALLRSLGDNLAVFYRDLDSFGALADTVVIVYSEFGRTNFENGTPGSGSSGTDHGHASNTLVFGGPVVAGVCGEGPNSAELQDEEYNALLPRVDVRDIFSEAIRWLGIDPLEIFQEAGYQPSVVGVIG